MRDRLALNDRPCQFFANNSHIADMFSIVSASNRFSLPFSSSNDLSRLVPGTVMLPNLLFHA